MNLNLQHPASSSRKNVQTPSLPFSGDDFSKTKGIEPAGGIGNQAAESRRREFRWSKAVRDLVRANMNATGAEVSALLSRLAEESGNPRWACRRFVRSMGIRARRPYRVWTEQEQRRLLKLIDLHPVNEISKLMRRSQKLDLAPAPAPGSKRYVRNALVVVQFYGTQRGDRNAAEAVTEAVRRIEWTLREVLPKGWNVDTTVAENVLKKSSGVACSRVN